MRKKPITVMMISEYPAYELPEECTRCGAKLYPLTLRRVCCFRCGTDWYELSKEPDFCENFRRSD